DAEIPATVRLTNETPSFSATPAMALSFGTSSDGFAVVDSQGCEDDDTSGAYFHASSPIASGQSIQERVFLFVPGYYSPQYPDGDASRAALHRLQVNIYGEESDPSGQQTGTDPSGAPLPDDFIDLSQA